MPLFRTTCVVSLHSLITLCIQTLADVLVLTRIQCECHADGEFFPSPNDATAGALLQSLGPQRRRWRVQYAAVERVELAVPLVVAHVGLVTLAVRLRVYVERRPLWRLDGHRCRPTLAAAARLGLCSGRDGRAHEHSVSESESAGALGGGPRAGAHAAARALAAVRRAAPAAASAALAARAPRARAARAARLRRGREARRRASSRGCQRQDGHAERVATEPDAIASTSSRAGESSATATATAAAAAGATAACASDEGPGAGRRGADERAAAPGARAAALLVRSVLQVGVEHEGATPTLPARF